MENLHAVSHFKHETFTVLKHRQDFEIIAKESSKRVTKWAAKYFTHEKSYYPVPQTNMEFANVNFIKLYKDCLLRLIAAIYKMAELQSYLQTYNTKI